MILERDIDVVVMCGFDPTLETGPAVEEPTFAARLRMGTAPDWLVRRPASSRASGLAIYDVVADRSQ